MKELPPIVNERSLPKPAKGIVIAVTGHRPDKLGGEFMGIGPYSDHVRSHLQYIVEVFKPSRLITGMALGVDQIWAEIAIANKIPFTAAIPCYDQDSTWPNRSMSRYHSILMNELCTKVLVSEVYYKPWVMQVRNEWMVNNS